MPVETLLNISSKLRKFSDIVGKGGSIFILPLVFFTMWDVVMRKLGGMQIWLIENWGPAFESTKIQEWEWHWHTALFALVLGYGYVNNRHVRVDLVRENLSFRTQAWIEFIGTSFFMIPYCLIVGWFAFNYAWEAFLAGEISPSTVGLPYRWIIKFVLASGISMAALAGIAVWLETVVVLLGPKDKRFQLMCLEWPEEQKRRADARRALNAEKAAQKL